MTIYQKASKLEKYNKEFNQGKSILEINLKNNLNPDIKSEFIKVTNPNSADKIIEQLKEKTKNDITTIVYNFVDMLSHSKTEMQIIKELASNDKAYRSLTKSWFDNSPLLDIIKKSIELNCKVIITTDHGTINVKSASKVIGDKNTSQNLRYKTGKSLTYSSKDNIVFNDPHVINLPKSSINSSYIFAKEDFYLVYPNNFNYYSNFYCYLCLFICKFIEKNFKCTFNFKTTNFKSKEND